MEWKALKQSLRLALSTLPVVEIHCIAREHNVVDLCIVLDDCRYVSHLRQLTRLRVVDTLISRNAPDLYRSFLFTYEVWDKRTWGRQKVKDVIDRMHAF